MSIATQFFCRQCGAVLPVEQGTQFVTCEFCQATNFVDKGGAVFHYAVRPTVDETAASAALRRWMAGNQTVKDLDKKAQIERPIFQYFPLWMVRTQQNNQEKVVMEPAAGLSVTELTELTIPASDLQPYDHTQDGNAVEPTVPLETVKKWLAQNQRIAEGAIKESALVHVPIFMCKYSYQGRNYTAVVDAASSKVFAAIYPSKWEAPYFAIGSLGCVLYFLAALIPMCGYTTYAEGGLALGVAAYVVAAIVLAVPIFAAAAYVSAKV
jgi:hypothetical protein